MVLLFRPQHVRPILEGRKTQTRRLWPAGCRVKVGSLHWATTKMLDKRARFARLRIARVWQQNLGDVSDDEGRAEGYRDRGEFFGAFASINGLQVIEAGLRVWAVEFEIVRDSSEGGP